MKLPRTILLAGASGLIGAALVERLRARECTVLRLVRRKVKKPDEIRWDPSSGTVDLSAIDGLDAVVNLCGENIAAKRWNAAQKKKLRESRVTPTRVLAEAIARLRRKPAVLVNASATGFYGSRGEEVVNEGSESGEGFLPELSREWEGSTAAAEAAGVRVVHVRTGIVLAKEGGILKKLVPVFNSFLGGPVGSGEQWMSWISLRDELTALEISLADKQLSGPVNAVSPNPVRNSEFASTLAGVLGRTALVPVPVFAVKLLFGEMGQTLLLEGVRVQPAVLESGGFPFDDPTLAEALRSELGS